MGCNLYAAEVHVLKWFRNIEARQSLLSEIKVYERTFFFFFGKTLVDPPETINLMVSTKVLKNGRTSSDLFHRQIIREG